MCTCFSETYILFLTSKYIFSHKRKMIAKDVGKIDKFISFCFYRRFSLTKSQYTQFVVYLTKCMVKRTDLTIYEQIRSLAAACIFRRRS